LFGLLGSTSRKQRFINNDFWFSSVPEGPEIHRAASKLQGALEGRVISSIECHLPHYLRQFEALEGTEIQKVQARGKAILVHFDDVVVYSHNQLYGRWTVNLRSTKPKQWNRSLRLAYSTPTHTARLWSSTDIVLLEPWEIESHPYLCKLGPDIVTEPSETLLKHCRKSEFQRRKLKTLLLDQGFFSGVGNYLRSEILFCSGLHPERTLGSLNQVEQRDLAYWSTRLANQSLTKPGITVDLELYEMLRQDGQSRGQARHWVFTRDERSCHRCGTLIQHIRPSGRRLDFCPTCQTM